MTDFDQLRKLHQLREEGILTDVEFEAQKQIVLGQGGTGLQSHHGARQGHASMPIRFDTETRVNASGSTQSTGIVVSGSVCPSCQSPAYVTAFTIWHGLLAFSFFPIGLCSFLAPVKRCTECSHEYGAGKTLVTFAAWFYGISFLVIGLVVLVIFAS